MEDARVAIDAGADYLGFILYPPSPRAIDTTRLRSLILDLKTSLPGVFTRVDPPLLVGVFVNQSAASISEVINHCGLDLVQLSGDEDTDGFNNPANPIYGRVYKAIRPLTKDEAITFVIRYTNLAAHAGPNTPSLLVDTPHKYLYGGTGTAGDWDLAADIATSVPRLMLAGGLNPTNVAGAVHMVKPFAVDVAGGVEESPGVKDHSRIRAFIKNAKNGSIGH